MGALMVVVVQVDKQLLVSLFMAGVLIEVDLLVLDGAPESLPPKGYPDEWASALK